MMGHSYIGDDVQAYDSFWDRASWQYKFSFWPRRCHISKKHIWLTGSYKGTAMWTGPGEPVFEYRWLTSEEFILGKLKGLI